METRLLVSMIGMNRCAGTQQAVEAALSNKVQFHLVLTNQNSTDGTGEFFDSVKNRHPSRVTVFHEKENTFFQPPNNRAYIMAAKMGCEFFMCLNDDAIIPSDGLEQMISIMDGGSEVAIVGAGDGCSELNHSFHGQGGRLEFIEGSCAMYRISAMRSHRPTLFWERLSGIYAEDSEASLFLQEKGYKIAKADFRLPHARSATVNRDEATRAACAAFQEQNHRLCRERYAHWLKVRRFDFPIVLKRTYAIGDTLLVTPIIRAIAQSNPLSPIHVQTNSPELFDRNPHVVSAGESVSADDALVIDLDLAYENRPMTHIVHAYEQATRSHLPGLGRVDLKTSLWPSDNDRQWASSYAGGRKLACIGSDPTTWGSKNWPDERYSEIRHRLESQGWSTVSVGVKNSEVGTSIHQLAALLAEAKLFVGNDSFPLHAAQAAGCPTVGIFGPTSARFILTKGSKAYGVESNRRIPCAGIRHRTSGKTFVECSTDCINSITVDDVWRGIEKLGVL